MADPKTYTQEEYDAMTAERDAVVANRNEVLKEAKRAKDALKNYDGFDPAEFKALKEAAVEAERKKAASEGDFKALEKQLVDRHGVELKGKDDKIGKLTKAIEKRAIRLELQNALIAAGARKGSLELLVEHGAKYGRLRETEDDYEAFVADESGNPRIADGKGTPMDFATFAQETLKAKYPDLFEGTGSTGGGATKSSGGATGGTKVIASGDNAAFLANLDGIAAGTTTVQT